MRKAWLAMIIVVVAGVAYLGAQAYSSHVFERELSHGVAALDGEWQVSRDGVEQGWFLSRGQLKIAHARADNDWISVPYEARHGLLSTRISGSLQGYLRNATNAEQRLFGDIIPSAEPRWTATFHTLDRQSEGRLDIAAFDIESADVHFSFSGAELKLQGRASNLQVRGQVAPLQLRTGDAELSTGPLHFDGSYQSSDAGNTFFQRDELILEHLEYRSRQHAPITLTGLRYSDETRLDDQLRLDASLSLEEATMADETLFTGRVDLAIDRINGDAVRQLVEDLEAEIERHGGDLSSLDESQQRVLFERLAPTIQATLADSPRFTLESATLTSPMFGIDTRGYGELTLDGQDIEALSMTEGFGTRGEAWRQRLNGHFTLHDIPPLVALQLGLPMETRKIEVSIAAGRVHINDRPLPSGF